jgi:hypothetical protein
MNIVLFLISALAAVLILIIVGLSRVPKPFSAYSRKGTTLETVELPPNLPAPVEHFYRQIYGERVPVITSAVLSGRASMRINRIRMPGRWRFTHIAGQGYRHYIESTIFGLPFLKINEHYLDGKARLELPFGVVENEVKIDSAANLGVWAETVWLPAVFITDPRVRWEAIDETTARLIVPWGGDKEQTFTVTFDTQTGMLKTLESLRYRDANDEKEILWLNNVLDWSQVNGYTIPSPASVTWTDQRYAWATFNVDEVVYNADVSEYILATGK